MKRPTIYERTLCANIATCRLALGLTQQGLANALGVTRARVGAWEQYEACPRLQELRRLAAVFARTIEELVMGRIIPA